ncbi:MAG: cytochrome P450 [Cyanobacteria bacterium SW_9_44_58]|nr:MAG: cytochrome P450 [Cyanobacteria bacterium SW_9_44_58]
MTITTPIKEELPPGPTTHALQQLIKWTAEPLNLLEESFQKYGDPFTLRFRKNNPFVYISNPESIQEILSRDCAKFDSGRNNHILLPIVGEHSILLADGKQHARQRKLIFPPFHGEKIRHYGEIITKITQKTAKQWEDGKPFSMRPAMQQITLEVIMQAVFGISDSHRSQQLKTRLTKSLELTGGSILQSSLLFFPVFQKDFPGSPWRNFLQRQKAIHQRLQAEIEQRRHQGKVEGNDILSLLMSAEDEDGNPMSDGELRDQLITLLFAGHETTATALAWAFYWIHKLPNVRDKLLAELATVTDVSDFKSLNRLRYLHAVCMETLRIYPVAILTFPRIAKSTVTIGNYEYPPETVLAPCIYLLHQREDIYPNPKQFRPERFLEREFSPYEFMPFGGGSRRCVGDVFAPMEMKIVIATVLKQYRLALAEKKEVKPVRRGVTVAPAGGVKMVLD